MDVKSIASRVSADGLSPAPYVKEVLNENSIILPKNKGETTTLFRAEMSRALLHESILYLLRSMSQIVSYEAAYTKHQFSWAAVTLLILKVELWLDKQLFLKYLKKLYNCYNQFPRVF
jgi:hypothetical protein